MRKISQTLSRRFRRGTEMLQRTLPPLEILTIIGICIKMELPATGAGIEVERLIEKQPKD